MDPCLGPGPNLDLQAYLELHRPIVLPGFSFFGGPLNADLSKAMH